MEIFISYSHLDKNLAGEVKSNLESICLLKAFLAHEDILPSTEWLDEILKQLDICHIFIPILTENFDKSDWTTQEAGIAIAGKKLIIPFKFSVDPRGFLSRWQAIPISDESQISRACYQIRPIIANTPIVGDLFKDAVIKKFGESGSFDEAANEADNLLMYEDLYTPEQINTIIKNVIKNNQIHLPRRVKPKLRHLIDKYKDRIDSTLYDNFDEAIRRML